jgi:hypothetical protein
MLPDQPSEQPEAVLGEWLVSNLHEVSAFGSVQSILDVRVLKICGLAETPTSKENSLHELCMNSPKSAPQRPHEMFPVRRPRCCIALPLTQMLALP